MNYAFTNFHLLKAFACNRASVAVQVRGGDDSQGSFMKFTFLQTPEAQVHGPVLQSRVFAFRCLQSNTACIILGSILPSPLPPAAGHRIAYDCGLEPLSAPPPMSAVTVPSSLSITPVNGGGGGSKSNPAVMTHLEVLAGKKGTIGTWSMEKNHLKAQWITFEFGGLSSERVPG